LQYYANLRDHLGAGAELLVKPAQICQVMRLLDQPLHSL
jgi:hypothetical protein